MFQRFITRRPSVGPTDRRDRANLSRMPALHWHVEAVKLGANYQHQVIGERRR
jgi:hypothetical protein